MDIQVGVSNRHVHLTEQDYRVLCGDTPVVKRNDLNQPGMFAATQTFILKTKKAEITNVRFIGPFRKYTQVEISKTDAYKFGLNPPVRTSGDLKGSESITIVGPKGELTITEGCIIADRHIHVDDRMLKYYHLEGKTSVNVLIGGEKGGILSNVHLKKSDKAYFEMHLDTDDANGFLLKSGDIVKIIED